MERCEHCGKEILPGDQVMLLGRDHLWDGRTETARLCGWCGDEAGATVWTVAGEPEFVRICGPGGGSVDLGPCPVCGDGDCRKDHLEE